MTVTTLDPKTALVVIDLQEGIKAFAPAEAMAGVIPNAVALLDAFRKRNLPVCLVNVAGGAPGRNEHPMRGEFPANFADLVPELKKQPTDHLVTKKTWGAFTNTDLEAWLKGQGITQIVLCGVATSIGVESTARFAHEYGFNVTLATDAMTDPRAEAHAYSLAHVFPRIGEAGTTRAIIDLLERSAQP